MTPIAVAILDQAGNQLGNFLPRLGGAIVLLVAGVLLARLIARLLAGALRGAGLDSLAERAAIAAVLERAGLGRSLTKVLATAVRWSLTVVVVFAALSLLGLQFLSESLNRGVLLLPAGLTAAALLLAGVVLAGFARERVDRLAYQLDLPVALGRLAQVTVIAVFAISAAAQIAISTVVLLVLIAILLAGFTTVLALAFGLGGQGLARELSAGRHVRSAFPVGQDISVAGSRGRVLAIESTSTVLDAGAGQTVRVPNHILLESVVTVHGQAQDAPPSTP